MDNCEYGALKDDLLRDRIVVGIRDKGLSEKLQMDPSLTLEKAKTQVRQKEAVLEHRQELHKANVEGVGYQRKKPKGRSNPHSKKGGARGPHKTNQPNRPCMRCGKPRHPAPDKCPALSATCFKCRRKGHYESQCLSKTVAASAEGVEADSEEDDLPEDEIFIGAIETRKGTVWLTNVQLQGKNVKFKMDTGAEVTVISEAVYHSLKNVQLEETSRGLYGPAHQSLEVIGQFTGSLKRGRHTHSEKIYVVRGLHYNLLGLPAITTLHLIKRIGATTEADETSLIYRQFPKVFKGLGTLGGDYTIKLKENAHPYSLFTPRRVPFPQRKQVQEELARMESLGVISKVSDPTPWCAGMVVVKKKTGAVRICVDLKPLNESVLREVHPILRVDEALAQLAGAAIFSKLDANSGFWQIPLSPESRLLTTFVTPFGRYCFNKLPFGISSAPELFQRRMNSILEGLDGVTCLMDDVLIFGKDKTEHDVRLRKVLERLQTTGVTLNSNKCVFNKREVKFLGHVISKDGVKADPEKTSAIRKMEVPQSVSELRRFLGMVNQLGKFSPRISELSQPLRELLSTKRAWLWGPEQDRSFQNLKEELSKPTTLALYNPQAELKVSADASSFGLGSVLFQQEEEVWKPVAYASRSMSETEMRYAQIEKEALAVTWACEKYTDYLLGRKFLIESDHKPLIPLLNTKQLDNLPPRVLRFRLRLARYDYTVQHVPGKDLYTADTLSRAPVAGMESEEKSLQEEVEMFVDAVQSSLPATKQRLDAYKQAQEQDSVCLQLMQYCQQGWPQKDLVRQDVTPYWKSKEFLTECNGLLMYGHRIVVPKSLQRETLQKIHTGHQGIERCRTRVTSSVWWPGVSHQMAQVVQQCLECAKNYTPPKEPLIVSKLPDYPWQVVGTDLFELEGKQYLLTVDYFSRFPEVNELKTTTSATIIQNLKSLFSRHGIPETVRSDNGPQFSSQEFAQFASSYEFNHITSSPRFPQSNGQVERCVKTVKQMLQKSKDPQMALLSYRTTPLPWCGLSPAELSMGRKLRTLIPQTDKHLVPEWTYLNAFRAKNKLFKETQRKNFNKRHRVRDLSPIPDNTDVWVTSEDQTVRGRVIEPAGSPRSYVVETPTGQVHRNRSHLNVVPDQSETQETIVEPQGVPTESLENTPERPAENSVGNHSAQANPSPPRRIMTRSQTGTERRMPNYLWLKRGDVA